MSADLLPFDSDPRLLPTIVPLDRFKINPDIDGRAGNNRATHVHAQFAANDDLNAIRVWLDRQPADNEPMFGIDFMVCYDHTYHVRIW